jgi:hypothetical protein
VNLAEPGDVCDHGGKGDPCPVAAPAAADTIVLVMTKFTTCILCLVQAATEPYTLSKHAFERRQASNPVSAHVGAAANRRLFPLSAGIADSDNCPEHMLE